MKSNMYHALNEDWKFGLSKLMLEAVVNSVPDLSGFEMEYYSTVDRRSDVLLDFIEDSVFVECPVKFVFLVHDAPKEIMSLNGQAIRDFSTRDSIKLMDLKFDFSGESKQDVKFEVTGTLLVKVKIMDKISETFTSKANPGLKQFAL